MLDCSNLLTSALYNPILLMSALFNMITFHIRGKRIVLMEVMWFPWWNP